MLEKQQWPPNNSPNLNGMEISCLGGGGQCTKLFWNLHPKPKTVYELKVALEKICDNFPQVQWKKRSEETQTLRAGCSKAEPNIFAPSQTLFPGARDDQNLTSWRRSLPLPTNPVWWGSMHVISSYRGYRPNHTHKHTHTHTNTPTHSQDRLQYTALQLARSVINKAVQSFTNSLTKVRERRRKTFWTFFSILKKCSHLRRLRCLLLNSWDNFW